MSPPDNDLERGDGDQDRGDGERGGGRGRGLAADYGRYAGLGVTFAGTFLLFGAVGWWLDGKLGTEPWLMSLGIFVGAAAAFVWLVRQVPPPRGSARKGPGGRGAGERD